MGDPVVTLQLGYRDDADKVDGRTIALSIGERPDESGNFVCPCGFKRTVKFNVERHMLVCKTVKAATMDVDEAAMAELKHSLAAKDICF